MVAPNDSPLFEPAQTVHLIASREDYQGVFLGTVEAADQKFVSVRLLTGGESAATLAVGTQVHLVHATGRWERARVTQVEMAEHTIVSLEMAPTVASLPERGHHRQYHRVTAQGLYGYVSLVTGKGATRFRVQILDLSAGGANIMAHRELQKGDELHLRLPLVETSGWMDVRGRLAWSTGVCGSWMAGVQFSRLSERESQKIQRFVFNLRWRGGSLAHDEA